MVPAMLAMFTRRPEGLSWGRRVSQAVRVP